MKYSVSPLTCGRCVRSITEALHGLDPAATVHVDLAGGTVDAEGAFDAIAVVAALANLGYDATPQTGPARSGGGCCGTCHA